MNYSWRKMKKRQFARILEDLQKANQEKRNKYKEDNNRYQGVLGLIRFFLL